MLSLIVLLGFTALFPGWFDNRQVVMDEITARFMSVDDQVLRQQARDKQIDFKAYKAQVLALRATQKRKAELREMLAAAHKSGDNVALKNTLVQMQRNDVPSRLFVSAIENENIGALTAMSEAGYKCILDDASASNGNVNRYNNSSVSSAFYKSNNADVFSEWVGLGCYQGQVYFIKNLLKQNKQALFANVAINNTTELFWSDVLWESVLLKMDSYAASLIDKGVGRTDRSELFATLKGLNISSTFDDILLESINLRLALVSERILSVDKNYIRRNELSKSVLQMLLNRHQRNMIEIFQVNVLNLSELAEVIPKHLVTSVNKGDVNMIRLLLSLDSTLSMSSFEAHNLTALNRALRGSEVIHFPQLVDRGLNFKAFKYQGLDQLSQALSLGDEILVSKILAMGVNPKRLYRGRSILATPIGGDLTKQKAINTSMINAGATNDLGELVRHETGVKYAPNCSIGKHAEITFQTPKYYQPITALLRKQKTETLTSYQVCEVALLICTKNAETVLDDCFESVPVCPQRVEDKGFHVKGIPSPVCCPSEAKKRYNEMRCSGLGIAASVSTLSRMGFSETYGIPAFFHYILKHEERVDDSNDKENSPSTPNKE